ncbi:uncharacterized protein [Rutidosis leptorrhynchoides]|uniref:uncharacterized protein n=1 Tax=Rutidosis leptorrhynchoides TaxID=125765 RepID=UPI003A9A1DDE
MSNNNLQDVDKRSEVLNTLSVLTDLPRTHEHNNDHQNSPSSSVANDFFEFFRGGLSDEKMMSNAEDIIFCGKLVPINEQHCTNSPQPRENQLINDHQVPNYGCRRSRSESTSKNKTTTAKSGLILNSRSLDYKKLKRNSSMTSEPTTPKVHREGSGKKSSSSRWYVLFFGLVKVPPSGIDLRDMKNRQLRRTNSDFCDVIPINQSVDNKACSSRLLGFLSCKSSTDDVLTTPLRYVPKV